MRKTVAVLLGLSGVMAAASTGIAQDHSKHGAPAAKAAPSVDHSKMDHSKMGHGAPAAGDSASTKAFKAANDKMHTDMAISFTGDADVDFVKGMIPHHEGAVAMAKIVLQHGKDPVIRKLAEEIIKAQDSEIVLMNAWLAKNGKR